jgi:hypothetical protein
MAAPRNDFLKASPKGEALLTSEARRAKRAESESRRLERADKPAQQAC